MNGTRFILKAENERGECFVSAKILVSDFHDHQRCELIPEKQ
jgi:hypothetical protein